MIFKAAKLAFYYVHRKNNIKES